VRTENWQGNMRGLRLVGEGESGPVLNPYGPVRAGLTTSHRTQSQALSELLNCLEREVESLNSKYYDTVTIAQLLPFVIKSFISETALEQSQILINDGTPRKPSAPAEGGNLLAMLVDIKKAYEKLDKYDQDILRLRYHDNLTLQIISEYLECAISTVDRRCTQALRKLQNNIGGESPWQ